MSSDVVFESDFLVIGSGIAGLSFALRMAAAGSVNIITKKQEADSSTNFAQGGIACVLSSDDNFANHIQDTLECGAGLCHADAVELVVREGPEVVQDLIRVGVEFSRDPQTGELALGREGGHHQRRIVHAHDFTGQMVETSLLTALKQLPQARMFEHQVSIELLVVEQGGRKRCCGARVIDDISGELRFFLAGMVLLATGGCGRVYLHTTNPLIATGDGVAMAYRAGARVANMEFIQFHPTSLYRPVPESRSFLISEAVRGEGGILKTFEGQTFMERYHPLGCLAPRDVVARSIDQEMKTSGSPHVWLDLRHLDAEFIRQRFPNIYSNCLERGLDITKVPIPVVPAAHYTCGGVMTDEFGETDLPGLFATGEVACTGLHGANRLASNSLLEALVYSRRAAQKVLSQRDLYRPVALENLTVSAVCQRVDADFEAVRLAHCTDELRRLMWDYVGIVRSDERLKLARRRLDLLREEVEGYLRQGYCNGALLELWNMTQVAELIVHCALLRKESRGLHYNLNHPEKNDTLWRKDTILRRKNV